MRPGFVRGEARHHAEGVFVGVLGMGQCDEAIVEAANAAERARVLQPPFFVDCRAKRKGRAKGFVDDRFIGLVTESRYEWMEDLGNEAVATGDEGVRIKNPVAIDKLLTRAQQTVNDGARVIFYCACEFPSLNGALTCHRLALTDLLLEHAKSRDAALPVVEWPGGEPMDMRMEVDRKLFSAVMRDSKSIPFRVDRLQDFAGLPWGSIFTLKCDDGKMTNDILV